MQILDTINTVNISQNNGLPNKNRFADAARTAGAMPIWGANNSFAAHLNEPASTPIIKATPKSDSPSFGDIIDIINPLHHLPVIGHLYRHITGDEISPAARFAGGALFGGFIGAGTALASLALNDVKDAAVASFNDEPRPTKFTLKSPYKFGEMPRMAGSTHISAQTMRETPLA